MSGFRCVEAAEHTAMALPGRLAARAISPVSEAFAATTAPRVLPATRAGTTAGRAIMGRRGTRGVPEGTAERGRCAAITGRPIWHRIHARGSPQLSGNAVHEHTRRCGSRVVQADRRAALQRRWAHQSVFVACRGMCKVFARPLCRYRCWDGSVSVVQQVAYISHIPFNSPSM